MQTLTNWSHRFEIAKMKSNSANGKEMYQVTAEEMMNATMFEAKQNLKNSMQSKTRPCSNASFTKKMKRIVSNMPTSVGDIDSQIYLSQHSSYKGGWTNPFL